MSLASEISTSLQLPVQYIERLAKRASHLYRTYPIPKRTGGDRIINHPSPELKALQRWLQIHVVSIWPVHQCCWSYRPAKTIFGNATVHASSAFLLRMDFSEFFPSITQNDILRFLRSKPPETLAWERNDEMLFCDIVCMHGRLTIGAPTSPGVSNAICLGLDEHLAKLAGQFGLAYTRYADDLFFSCDTQNVLRKVPNAVENVLRELEWPSELRINAEKTRHLSRKSRRTVTGIVLSSDGRAAIARSTKRTLRCFIHKWATLNEKQQAHTRGLFWFVVSLEPDFYNAMVLKYGPELVRNVAGH